VTAPVDTPALRERVIATARALNPLNLNRGKAGNVSARVDGGFVITPSGMAYDALRADDIARISDAGSVQGRCAPSSEWRMHEAIYAARSDLAAIVHAHAPFCTALACLGRGIPPFHYMIAVAGGDDVRCAPYATFGTSELAVHTVAALSGRKACLLANHGLVAGDENLERALALAVDIEALAEIYCRALAIGGPALLDRAEIARVIEAFRCYGQPSGA